MAEQKKTAELSESGQWIKTGQGGGVFECVHCSGTFQTHNQLRQHEVDCISDDTETWEL